MEAPEGQYWRSEVPSKVQVLGLCGFCVLLSGAFTTLQTMQGAEVPK